MKNSNFQSVVCENYNKLGINSLYSLKVSTKYYVLTQHDFGQAILVSNDCTSIVEQILQYLPYEAPL